MRALIVTSMYPTALRPAWGIFVRDQVQALRKLDDVDVEVYAVPQGGTRAYFEAAREIRRHYGHGDFDVVHAHFGLSAWPALLAGGRNRVVTLHGTDLAHPRTRAITLGALRLYDLTATVSAELAQSVPPWAHRGDVAVLPCGVDTDRFTPRPRAQARAVLGLDPHAPYLLFPADPARSEKRYDRARQIAGEVPIQVLKDVDPEVVPLWFNAVNAVLVPSEREGFGLAVLEALACDVPVLATPVGIAREALDGIDGTYCGPFDASAWKSALEPHLASDDPRVEGRAQAERYSATRMAERVLKAWRALDE